LDSHDKSGTLTRVLLSSLKQICLLGCNFPTQSHEALTHSKIMPSNTPYSSVIHNMNRFGKLNALQGGADINAIMYLPWDEPDPIQQPDAPNNPEKPLGLVSSKVRKP
jgi:hypothetical protein